MGVGVTGLRPSRDLQRTQQHMSSGTGQHTSLLALKIINRSGHDNLQQQSKYTNQGVSTCLHVSKGSLAPLQTLCKRAAPLLASRVTVILYALVILYARNPFCQLILFAPCFFFSTNPLCRMFGQNNPRVKSTLTLGTQKSHQNIGLEKK